MSDFDFSINEETETQEEGLSSVLSPGIHNNLILKKVEYITPDEDDTTAKWEEAIEFTFETTMTSLKRDNNGNLITDTNKNNIIISKAGSTISKREFFSKSKTDSKKLKNMLSRLKHIMTKFMPEEEAIVKGKDFKALCLSIVKKLDAHKEGKKVRIKVTKNGKYSNIPNYMPFIESMTVKGSKLQMSSKEYEGEEASNLDDLDMGAEIEIPDDL